jgi:hypothetical protein
MRNGEIEIMQLAPLTQLDPTVTHTSKHNICISSTRPRVATSLVHPLAADNQHASSLLPSSLLPSSTVPPPIIIMSITRTRAAAKTKATVAAGMEADNVERRKRKREVVKRRRGRRRRERNSMRRSRRRSRRSWSS